MNLHEFLIVCPLVFLAGFVDAIAGGGGLISLPAYMFAGIPVHHAIATNKLSSATGTAVSTWHLVKSKCVDICLVPGTVACAFVGSIAGANLALIISDKVLKTVLVFVLPVVAFCVLRDKDLKPVIPEGFTGTFLLLAFTKLGKLDMEKATGNVKVVNLTSNISALITFILAGKILWVLGLSASVFSIAGHYLGAHMVVKNGVKIIKPIILLVLALLLIKIVLGI